MMLLKKIQYDKLIGKVNSIDTSGFALKTKQDTDKSELENKNPDTSGLVKKTNYDGKIADIEGKIPDVGNLATKTALTSVENKIPSVSDFVKKTDYNTKVQKLKINLIIIVMTNILILQSLMNQLLTFLMRDQHRPI